MTTELAPVPAQTPTPAPTSRPGRWSRQVIGPFTLRHVVLLLATVLIVGGLLAVLTTPIGTPLPTGLPQPGSGFYRLGEPTEGLAVGQTAPELSGIHDGKPITLMDLSGAPVSLAGLRGHPVWVTFWASWCPPCQEETPVLREVYARHRAEGLKLVAVSVQETSVDDVRAYADTYSLPYTIGFDATSAVFHAWLGFGLPTHYFIDRDGVIRYRQYGPLSVARAEEILAPLLAEAASPSP